MTADAPLLATLWLDSANGRIIHQCHDDRILELWRGVLDSVSIAMPTLQSQRAFLDTAGNFSRSSVMVHYLISGHIAFQYEFTQVSFEPRWSKPLWEILNASVSQESQQIETLLNNLLGAMPSPNTSLVPLSSSEVFHTLPELLSVKWARFKRYVFHAAVSFSKLGTYGILWAGGMLCLLVLFASLWRLVKAGWISTPTCVARWGWKCTDSVFWGIGKCWSLVSLMFGPSAKTGQQAAPSGGLAAGNAPITVGAGPAAGFEIVNQPSASQSSVTEPLLGVG